jgi:hypothetical protein
MSPSDPPVVDREELVPANVRALRGAGRLCAVLAVTSAIGTCAVAADVVRHRRGDDFGDKLFLTLWTGALLTPMFALLGWRANILRRRASARVGLIKAQEGRPRRHGSTRLPGRFRWAAGLLCLGPVFAIVGATTWAVWLGAALLGVSVLLAGLYASRVRRFVAKADRR